MRNEGVVAGCQQMVTTWENQLSLLIQNDKNKILKPVKKQSKILYLHKPLFINTHKYNSEIFHLLKQKFD